MEYTVVEWRDGQPYSPEFDDRYFSANDGRGESEYVFLQKNELSIRFSSAEKFVIAETGFGSGLNFALTLKLWSETAPPDAQLDYIGIESAPLSPDDIKRVVELWPECEHFFFSWLAHYPLPVPGHHVCLLADQRVRLHLVFMDVQEALTQETLQVDAWYLDGFSPAHNPQIWNQQVYHLLAQNSAPAATLSTFSAAGGVRRGLQAAGFVVTKCKGHGDKREMITAKYSATSQLQNRQPPWFRLPVFLPATKHAVVIGAGLAGLTVAWALIQRGWKVTLVDKYPTVAGAASGSPAGLVMPRFSVDDNLDARVYRAAFLYALSQLNALQAVYAESHPGKYLWRDEGVFAELSQSRAQQMLAGDHTSAEYVRELVGEGVSGMTQREGSSLLSVPCAGWASPGLVCRTLLTLCKNNLNFIQADITALHQAESTWQALAAAGDVIVTGDLMVLANGVGANRFTQSEYLPVGSVRGQLTELELKPTAQLTDSGYSGEHYLVPSLDHTATYYCGASYHPDDPCPDLRHSDQQNHLDFVMSDFPGCFEIPDSLTGFVGFRAVSEDRLPVVGPIPDVDWYTREYTDIKHGKPESKYVSAEYLSGLYISAAHGSRGLTTSFLAAELIAAQVEATPLPVSSEICAGLSPARFLIRRLKRGV